MEKFVTDFLDKFNDFYDKLYDGIIDEDYNLIDKFDRLLKSDKNFRLLLAFFNAARHDIITSDREVNAFMLTARDWKKEATT